MVRPRSNWPQEQRRYGLGFHLHETGEAVWLEGCDAGVSCLSKHWPSTGTTHTVVSNWTDGAWPLLTDPRPVALIAPGRLRGQGGAGDRGMIDGVVGIGAPRGRGRDTG